MAQFTDDTGAWPLMEELLEQSMAELEKRNLGPIGFAMIQPGLLPVMDHAGNEDECSELIVWLTQAYTVGAGGFPEPDDTGTCVSEMAYEINVGLYRCAPGFTVDEPPTPDEQTEAARQQMADMAALRAGIRCWLHGRREYVLGGYTSYGPSGNAMGGDWSVIVGGLI